MEERINIPEDLTTDILIRLPVKSLSRFKCVSKTWYNLINNQDFVKVHLKQSEEGDANGTVLIVGRSSLHSFEFSSPHGLATELCWPEFIKDPYVKVRLIDSCHGLVCLSLYESKKYFLYNPATRAYKELPELTWKMSMETYSSYRYSNVFVYDCAAEDFKVLNFISYYNCDNGRIKIGEESQMYSLKANSWKVIPNPPLLRYDRSHNAVTNNLLHWIGFIGSYTEQSKVIMRLNLLSQTYDTMSLPTGVRGFRSHLAVLRGHLHLITDHVDIWMMKEYGVEESWTRVFYSPSWKYANWPMPYAYSSDGHKILVGREQNPKDFICCDLQSQKFSEYLIEGLPNTRDFVVSWVESLISPCTP